MSPKLSVAGRHLS